MNRLITDEQWSQYDEQGYLQLGKLLNDEDLAALQRRIDDIMLGKADVDYDRMLMQLDKSDAAYNDARKDQTKGFKVATLDYRKIQDLEYDFLFLRYIQRPIFREICARVYGAHADISCQRAMFFNKPAQKGSVLPYHQDGGGSWHLDRDPLMTVWTALDPATVTNGCVRVAPGTHKLGLLSEAGHNITPEQEKEYCSEEKVCHVELKAGEVMLMHNWLIHGSDVNRTDAPRRGVSICYVDARTRHVINDLTYPVVFGKGALVADEICITPQKA